MCDLLSTLFVIAFADPSVSKPTLFATDKKVANHCALGQAIHIKTKFPTHEDLLEVWKKLKMTWTGKGYHVRVRLHLTESNSGYICFATFWKPKPRLVNTNIAERFLKLTRSGPTEQDVSLPEFFLEKSESPQISPVRALAFWISDHSSCDLCSLWHTAVKIWREGDFFNRIHVEVDIAETDPVLYRFHFTFWKKLESETITRLASECHALLEKHKRPRDELDNFMDFWGLEKAKKKRITYMRLARAIERETDVHRLYQFLLKIENK